MGLGWKANLKINRHRHPRHNSIQAALLGVRREGRSVLSEQGRGVKKVSFGPHKCCSIRRGLWGGSWLVGSAIRSWGQKMDKQLGHLRERCLTGVWARISCSAWPALSQTRPRGKPATFLAPGDAGLPQQPGACGHLPSVEPLMGLKQGLNDL